MSEVFNYIKPELLLVAVVLYFLGDMLKKTMLVKHKYIPLILGGIGILVCALYVFATSHCATTANILMAFFTSITQGILVAGMSNYVYQIIKQMHSIE